MKIQYGVREQKIEDIKNVLDADLYKYQSWIIENAVDKYLRDLSDEDLNSLGDNLGIKGEN